MTNDICYRKTGMKNLMILVLQLVITNAKEDVEVTSISHPMLPINLGETRLVYTRHTLLHYINLDDIERNIIELKMVLIKHQNISNTNENKLLGLRVYTDRSMRTLNNLENKFEL